MPSELVFGFETEWMSFSAGAEPEMVAACALRALAQQVPHLPFHNGNGIFLENSSRCYLDCGHIETCTCEVSSPLDLVATVKAMERILLHISQSASRLLGAHAAIKFGRANVDPSSAFTYGQHESYLSAHPSDFYAEYLLPFLVTRPVWSGAGGLVPGSPGVAFAVAPRLLLFSSAAGNDTTGSRAIINLRNEPLAKPGNHRLHIIAGETLSSERGLYLKAGVTALAVRAADLGAKIGIEVRDPVKSLHVVARDPSCKEKIPLRDGRRLTAVQIQSEYLALIEKYLPDLPAWAPAVCRCWRTALAALAEDPLLLGRTLDWPIKYNIWKAHLKKLDVHADGKDLLAELREAASNTAYRDTAPSLELLLGPSSPILGRVAELNAILRQRGLKWTQLNSLAADRARLSEILDVRFGILGEGLFDVLDRQGVLEHRVLDAEPIERAIREAPPGTRAHLRSQAIKELAGRTDAACSWEWVVDKKRGALDLSDPREQSAHWQQTASLTHDEIAARAYQLWHERGCSEGSPEVDWIWAERQLREELERRTGGV